jgi:hypothetical protein
MKTLDEQIFELEQQLNIPNHLRYHNSKFLEKEILDKEIEKTANDYANKWIDGREAYYGFVEGAKWYREKLKAINDKTNG